MCILHIVAKCQGALDGTPLKCAYGQKKRRAGLGAWTPGDKPNIVVGTKPMAAANGSGCNLVEPPSLVSRKGRFLLHAQSAENDRLWNRLKAYVRRTSCRLLSLLFNQP